MTKCKCWVAVLIAVLLLPNVAASADPAKEAFEKGKSCLDKKHYDAAITAFTEAILLNPKDAVAYGNRGIAYRHKAKYDEAIADYTEAIRLNPKDAKAYNNRGLAYHALGMNGNTGAFDKAVADFTDYIRLDPKNAKAYKNRGFSYHERGLASEETGDLAMFMELVDRDNMGGRSIALKHKDQLDKAIADFTEAIRLDPKYIKAYICRGMAYFWKGELDKAIAQYTEAIRLKPQPTRDDDAYFVRGVAYFWKGAFDKVIADFTESIRLHPKDVWTYSLRGLAYEKIGEKAKAKKDYEQVEKLGGEQVP